jgi:hypothetical protein
MTRRPWHGQTWAPLLPWAAAIVFYVALDPLTARKKTLTRYHGQESTLQSDVQTVQSSLVKLT